MDWIVQHLPGRSWVNYPETIQCQDCRWGAKEVRDQTPILRTKLEWKGIALGSNVGIDQGQKLFPTCMYSPGQLYRSKRLWMLDRGSSSRLSPLTLLASPDSPVLTSHYRAFCYSCNEDICKPQGHMVTALHKNDAYFIVEMLLWHSSPCACVNYAPSCLVMQIIDEQSLRASFYNSAWFIYNKSLIYMWVHMHFSILRGQK